MNNYFSWHRIILVTRKDIYTIRKQIILAPSAICAFILMIGILSGRTGSVQNEFYWGVFLTILFAGGPIVISLLFRDSHNSSNIHNFLMLPASTAEKFLIRLFFSLFGIILIAGITVLAGSALTSLINRFIYQVPVIIFNPFIENKIWYAIQGFWVIQVPFFLGALWFRKNNLIKTLLTLFILNILLVLITGGLGYMILFQFLKNDSFPPVFFQLFQRTGITSGGSVILFRILLQGIIPIACWTASYFRLKEIQVKDGI